MNAFSDAFSSALARTISTYWDGVNRPLRNLRKTFFADQQVVCDMCVCVDSSAPDVMPWSQPAAADSKIAPSDSLVPKSLIAIFFILISLTHASSNDTFDLHDRFRHVCSNEMNASEVTTWIRFDD